MINTFQGYHEEDFPWPLHGLRHLDASLSCPDRLSVVRHRPAFGQYSGEDVGLRHSSVRYGDRSRTVTVYHARACSS